MRWVERRMADALLRLAGLAPIALAWACGNMLRQRVLATPDGFGLLDLVLAAVTFVAASGGVTLLTVGRHLFDRIRVARQWMPIDPLR